MSEPEVSVCIVTRGRPAALAAVLGDLAAQVGAPPWELLVAADDDAEVAGVVEHRIEGATVIPTLGLTLGANRNLLVDKARGEVLLFLDDDVRLPPRLLAGVAEVFAADRGIDVVGAPNLTPEHASRFARVQGNLLGDPWVTGSVSRRYRPLDRPRRSCGGGLTLCNLAVRAAARPRFPSGCRGGEELAMLADLRARRATMVLHPALTIGHERRPDLRAFATQIHKYGHGRGEVGGPGLVGGVIAAVALIALAATSAGRVRHVGAGALGAATAVVGVAAWRASPDGRHRVSDLGQAAVVAPAFLSGVGRGWWAARRRR